ncbi:response regulator [Oscillatoriales cyanobacterium LEGE 11467]|uniref:Response regulator n=1 Tax=Zarconia navalis LEGE 11467 TaxID=1828826 RepID=A0A928W072_9CYAN|nr:response regulator [Zarconia navalis]MBE9040895.1 response regulator [Zarconia navalis LEGE 11467]
MDILIVDDNINNLRLLSAILEEKGYQVRKVTNSKFALKTVALAPPDLILLDINMPEFDGYEVCRYLKAGDRTQDIPIIFLSAFSQPQQKREAFQVGGVDYITKPLQVEEVLARVKHQQMLYQYKLECQQANREAHLLRTIAIARARQPDRQSFAKVALASVCQTLHWDVGEIWAVRGTFLAIEDATYSSQNHLMEFVRQSRTRTFELHRDVPASIWKCNQPEWVGDLDKARTIPFFRSSTAIRAGLTSALAVPICFEQELWGILLLYCQAQQNLARCEIDGLEAVAACLSSFWVRARP